MDERRLIRVSKYLARHLRHDPGRIGLTLDEGGWAHVGELLRAAAAHGFPITPEELREVVAANDKRRYTIEGDRIRASQGHSVPVELGLPAVEPPEALYHGTIGRFVAAIRREGLRPMSRHHVHLSPDRETATRVGGAARSAGGAGGGVGSDARRRAHLHAQRQRGVAGGPRAAVPSQVSLLSCSPSGSVTHVPASSVSERASDGSRPAPA
ncbi:RNA 2'-phosphotransferase [Nonomuraea salmonea]|uniref:RNA 2'-phosphotransferase n=1 Tax=Nonomuraea salmonea TaxID=46181 RepID=UPI002FEB9956